MKAGVGSNGSYDKDGSFNHSGLSFLTAGWLGGVVIKYYYYYYYYHMNERCPFFGEM